MNYPEKFVIGLVSVAICAASVFAGYAIALNRNNHLNYTSGYTTYYEQRDSENSCSALAKDANADRSSAAWEKCTKLINYSYGFPFSYQKTAFDGTTSSNRAVYLLNIFLHILPGLIMSCAVWILGTRITTKRKRAAHHANPRH